ncbi:hypothetical protein GQ42DRAFT_119817, partial [Ramicandelaber brevisporus]
MNDTTFLDSGALDIFALQGDVDDHVASGLKRTHRNSFGEDFDDEGDSGNDTGKQQSEQQQTESQQAEQQQSVAGSQPRMLQACDLCRQRKVRCDAVRPRCANCIRYKAECHY